MVRIRFSVWLVSGYARILKTTFRCQCYSPDYTDTHLNQSITLSTTTGKTNM